MNKTLKEYIIGGALGTIVVFSFTRFKDCSNNPQTIEKHIIDTIKVPVQIPVIQFRDHETVKTVQLPPQADSNALLSVIAQMDSLRNELKRANVRSLFSADTITPLKDTIHIDCDEINRRISFFAAFGKREIEIERVRDVIIQMEKPKYAIGVGIGGVVSPSGLTYGLTLTLQYNFITF